MNSVGNGATNITNNSVENPPQNMEGPILAEAVQLVAWMENDHRRRMQNFVQMLSLFPGQPLCDSTKKRTFITLKTLKNSVPQNSVRKYEDEGSSLVDLWVVDK